MRTRCVLTGFIMPMLALAQEPVRLTRPDASFSEPFTFLASVRELSDGRVLVLDRGALL